ncbi:MAG: HNH endonuclease [Solirubrobacterales bacterium]|nr:HNH endonuclease [Solirubrobacterales bacterium]
MSRADRVAIHRRDYWTCRYCRAQTVAPPVLRFLSEIYPEEFPYHPNWKAGQVHPAYLLVSTSLDHVDPGARGGSWRGEENLLTACWPCNTGKGDLRSDEVGWKLLDTEGLQRLGRAHQCDARAVGACRPVIYRDCRRALTSAHPSTGCRGAVPTAGSRARRLDAPSPHARRQPRIGARTSCPAASGARGAGRWEKAARRPIALRLSAVSRCETPQFRSRR